MCACSTYDLLWTSTYHVTKPCYGDRVKRRLSVRPNVVHVIVRAWTTWSRERLSRDSEGIERAYVIP